MEEKLEVLKTVTDYIEKLKGAILSCTEEFHEGRLGTAYELLGEISKGLDWLLNAMELTKDVHKIDVLNLRDTFGEMIEALENEDTVLVADLLEYEIAEQLQNWQDVLEDIVA